MAGRRRYKRDERLQVTRAWLDLIVPALKQLGHDQRWLELEVGMARGALSSLLAGKQQTSNYVAAISKAIGIPRPDEMGSTDLEARFRAALKRLPEDIQRVMVAALEAAADAQSKK